MLTEPTIAVMPRKKFKVGGPKMLLADRFWSKVQIGDPDDCWPWLAALDRGGYGLVGGDNGKTVRAHRYAYAAKKGSIPKGKMVLHNCDRRDCCNPAHLKIGTAKDNAADAAVKGRMKRKLTDAQVLEIVRIRLETGATHKALAVQFGVSQNNISMILRGRTYGWLTGIGQIEMQRAA